MDFFENLERYRSWCAKSARDAEAWIRRCEQRPGMRFDFNLWVREDGSVWMMGSYGKWYRMLRDGKGPWVRTFQAAQMVPKEEMARCKPDDDWAWYRGSGEAAFWEDSRNRSLRGVALASTLLNQREEVEAWAKSYAGDRSSLESTNRDYEDLLERFAPGYKDVPDFGSICCTLHAWLDTLGGCDGIRLYAF